MDFTDKAVIGETIKYPNCFCKIMSRPYHKWEELIREYFLEFPDDKVSVKQLIEEITDNEYIKFSENWHSIHNAVCRAIRKLEKEGFLETRFFPLNGVRDILGKNDKPTRVKMIRLQKNRHHTSIAWDVEREEHNIFEVM